MSNCTISSRRLEKAAKSKAAKQFFQRDPGEDFDRLWVSAIDDACFDSLTGNFRNYGVEFAHNFGDWVDGRPEDGLYTIEQVASFKARKVYECTGLPCIASRTSFEVEPVPPRMNTAGGKAPNQRIANALLNPRITSGYKINDIDDHCDYLVAALRPMSDATRVTRFYSCLCYYDGEMEIMNYGVLDCDMIYCNSLRTYIPMSQGIINIARTLIMTHGLEYLSFLKNSIEQAERGGGMLGTASLKLRDRVLKDGKVLPNDIIDVSKFMDSQVDVNLMDECAKELVSANN